MTVSENIRRIFAPNAARDYGSKLSKQLDDAKAQVAELEARRDEVTYSASAGEEGADDALAKWRTEYAVAQERVSELQSAKRGALARQKADAAELAKEQRAAVIGEFRRLAQHQVKDMTKLAAAIENLSDSWRGFMETGTEMVMLCDRANLPASELFPWFCGVRPDVARPLMNVELLRQNKMHIASDGIARFAVPGVNEGIDALHGLAVQGTIRWDPAAGTPYQDLEPIVDLYKRQLAEVVTVLEQSPIPAEAIELEETKPLDLTVPVGNLFEEAPPPPRPTSFYYRPQSGEEERPIEQGGAAIPNSVTLPGDARDASIAAKVKFAELSAADQEAASDALIASIEQSDPALAAVFRAKRKAKRENSATANRINDLMRGDTL